MYKKKSNIPLYTDVRMKEIHKNRKNYTLSSPEDRDIPTFDKVKKHALRVSNNGKCWWVYQHIMNSFRSK